MPLYKLEEFDKNYRETFGDSDVKTLDVCTEHGVKVGSISDTLVDQNGRFRYLVIDTAFNSGSKKILLPVGLSRINYPAKRVYVDGLSKEQIERLPAYSEDIVIDEDFEERVRNVYRSTNNGIKYDRDTYSYQQEPNLYQLDDQYHQTFRLYEERLIANKNRIKTGEVTLGKHIETQTARVAVPIQKERVVIERVPSTASGTLLDPQEVRFHEGEIARIEVYEETPQIHKEAFVREEIRVKKVVEQDTFEAQDIIRREELDIDTGDLRVNDTDPNRPELV
ncbi:DUF2382 domain-containing protein [Calothrix sp. PCC 7507]|uniref:DUF2382 domain-containing protein n=1 Tax=Calothrix sp. PCC 7507 TaxID=99598 RepID=UPI00029F2194|nr:DUF2382 domain-containing protein [Calothrix sp. PCC 7507]AFY32883.1 hypothetical protein Cal7507_2454 [Calothrix sp. PCC 7507]